MEDAAAAHVQALAKAPALGFGLYIVSASPPFTRADAAALKADAAALIRARFPDAETLFAARGWQLPKSLGRVYDPGLAERELGFRCHTDVAAVLQALRTGAPLPFAHDPDYSSPLARNR